MNRPLNLAMGWIVATWLVVAFIAPMPWWAFFGCMVGAVATVAAWVALARWMREDDE